MSALLTTCFVGGAPGQDIVFDRDAYYQAVQYCRRQISPDRIRLSADRKIICFSGEVSKNTDFSLAKDLEEGGLFVVRSPGGSVAAAISFSNLIRDRHATVVVYDFCFSACADYFLIASKQTYIMKGTLVAWHNPHSVDASRPSRAFLIAPEDGGARKLRHGACRSGSFSNQAAYGVDDSQIRDFYKDRAISSTFVAPPDSLHVRKIAAFLYMETGVDRDVAWTLHPRYYPTLFRTKIVYEAYPESQDEVDRIAAALGLKTKVIYDP